MLVMENLSEILFPPSAPRLSAASGSFPAPTSATASRSLRAVTGSAPDIAGKKFGKSSSAASLSSVHAAAFPGEFDAALQIRNALEKVYRHPEKLTRDIGGKAGTSEFADAVISEIDGQNRHRPGRGAERLCLRFSRNRRARSFPLSGPQEFEDPIATIEILHYSIDSTEDGSKFATFWGMWGMLNPTRRLGVVLFQLGGPDTPAAIEPFLYNLFCDPDIIDFPFARIGPQSSCQTDLKYARTQGATSLRKHRRRLADSPFY